MLSTRVWRAAGARPYARVWQAMEHGGRGLLVAAEVFSEFELFYRECTSSPPSSPSSSSAAAASRPLTAFCGSPQEVEPLTVLLLKVLCDLRRLEEMRFLFAQCVLELGAERVPSIELFNVYLLAVSMADTFNEHEIENVVEVMRVKGARPDIVTKLSMYMLYLRLGQDEHVASWWPLIAEELRAIVAAGEAAQYPLLGLRLQHCLQTLTRLHHSAATTHECFQLLHAVSPARCTPALLVPYMVLSAANQAAPPSTVVELLRVLEGAETESEKEKEKEEAPRPTTAAAAASASDALETVEPPPPPALSSEVTAFRVLAKCAKCGDVASAQFLRAYLRRHGAHHTIVAPENAPAAALLYIAALAEAGRTAEALAVAEAELPEALRTPGERPKLFLESRRMTLLSADPLTLLVRRIAADGVDRALGELRAALAAGAAVTATSLDIVMAACAHLQDADGAERLLALYGSEFGAAPRAATYTALLRCYTTSPATAAVAGWRRVQALLGGELAEAGVALDGPLLRAVMDVALAGGDTAAALSAAALHVEAAAPVDMRQGARLLRSLALLGDADGLREAMRALRASKSAVDRATVAQCVASLRFLQVDGAADIEAL